MKIKVVSVKLKSLEKISEKAYLAKAFDGSSGIIPISQVFGFDNDIQKSEAYWISEWILLQKNIQYSNKKISYFDTDSKKFVPQIIIEKHTPEHKDPININPDESLIR